MIWLIGGTSETKDFAKMVSDKEKIIITVTTKYGASLLEGFTTRVGSLSYQDMLLFIDENSIEMVIDLSHPFAREVTKLAKKAAEEKNIRYLRYKREFSNLCGDINFEDVKSLTQGLEKLRGTFFFTTGVKMMEEMERVRGDKRFIYRILPIKTSMDEAERLKISADDLVMMKGPFSKEINIAFLKNFSCDYLVTKAGGEGSGFEEKILAAKEVGIKTIVVDKVQEEGITSLDELLKKSGLC